VRVEQAPERLLRQARREDFRLDVLAKGDVDSGRILTDQEINAVLRADLAATHFSPAGDLFPLRLLDDRNDLCHVIGQAADCFGNETDVVLAAQLLNVPVDALA